MGLYEAKHMHKLISHSIVCIVTSFMYEYVWWFIRKSVCRKYRYFRTFGEDLPI